MGTKAFLQKGRTKPGVVLPANAVARVNQANDRSALVREHERRQAAEEPETDPIADSLPNIGTSIAAKHCGATATATAHLTVEQAEPEVEPEPKAEPTVEEVEAPEAVDEPAEPEAEPGVESEPEASEPESEAAEPQAEQKDLTAVSGIGTALAERFATYGYRTLDALAQADADTINQIPGARNRGRQWIDEARSLLGLL